MYEEMCGPSGINDRKNEHCNQSAVLLKQRER